MANINSIKENLNSTLYLVSDNRNLGKNALGYNENEGKFCIVTLSRWEKFKNHFGMGMACPERVAKALQEVNNQKAIMELANEKWTQNKERDVRNMQTAIDTVFGETSEKTIDLFKTRFESWMKDLPAEVKRKDIREILLPGTHDSAATKIDYEKPVILKGKILKIFNGKIFKGFDKGRFFVAISHLAGRYPFLGRIIKSWTIAQDLSLGDQLKSGIRFLDFRISYNETDKEFYLTHTFSCIKLRDALQEIKAFMGDHPEEILTIAMKSDWGNHTTMGIFNQYDDLIGEGKEKEICDLIKHEIGDLLVKNINKAPLGELTIENLVNKKQRVLFYYGGLDKKFEPPEGISYDYVSYLFKVLWPNKADPKEFEKGMDALVHARTVDTQAVHILPYALTPQAKEAVTGTISTFFSNVFPNIFKKNNLSTYAEEISDHLEGFLESNKKDLLRINALTVDFPKNYFVYDIIKHNLDRVKKEKNPNPGSNPGSDPSHFSKAHNTS